MKTIKTIIELSLLFYHVLDESARKEEALEGERDDLGTLQTGPKASAVSLYPTWNTAESF